MFRILLDIRIVCATMFDKRRLLPMLCQLVPRSATYRIGNGNDASTYSAFSPFDAARHFRLYRRDSC